MSAIEERKALTDPYGILEYAVGSGDDFVCFDYYIHPNGMVRLHAVVNSETGSFIENMQEPFTVGKRYAINESAKLVASALDWCSINNVRHDKRGWNQDPYYFVRELGHRLKDARYKNHTIRQQRFGRGEARNSILGWIY